MSSVGNFVVWLALTLLMRVNGVPRYAFLSFDPLGPPGPWPAVVNTEPWQLYIPARRELLCVRRLNFAPPVAGAEPLLTLVNVPNPFGIPWPGGVDPCSKPGFYIWIAQCTPTVGDYCGGGPIVMAGGATATAANLAGFVATTGAIRFIITYVGRTEPSLDSRFQSHFRSISPAYAEFKPQKAKPWRAWLETRRSFIVGFPAPQGTSTGLEMMFLRPSLLSGGSGVRFPLNEGDSTWGNRIPPDPMSRISCYFTPQLIAVRDLLIGAGCNHIAARTDAIRYIASLAGGGGASAAAGLGAYATQGGAVASIPLPIVPAWTCPATAATLAAPPVLAPFLPVITAKARRMWFPPGVAGNANTQPPLFAFTAPLLGAAPHVVSMLPGRFSEQLQSAIVVLSATRQLLGASLP
jgi:hypothetical protein